MSLHELFSTAVNTPVPIQIIHFVLWGLAGGVLFFITAWAVDR